MQLYTCNPMGSRWKVGGMLLLLKSTATGIVLAFFFSFFFVTVRCYQEFKKQTGLDFFYFLDRNRSKYEIKYANREKIPYRYLMFQCNQIFQMYQFQDINRYLTSWTAPSLMVSAYYSLQYCIQISIHCIIQSIVTQALLFSKCSVSKANSLPPSHHRLNVSLNVLLACCYLGLSGSIVMVTVPHKAFFHISTKGDTFLLKKCLA